jgi:hypothetical protein
VEAVAAIVAFALFLGVIYMIIKPFLAPEEIYDEAVHSPELVSQKNRVIGAIREIDMDYQTGKLSEEDYKLLRSRYTAAAAEIIRRMDEEAEETARQEAEAPVEETSAAASDDGATDDGATGAEAPESPETAETADSPDTPDDELERMIAERKASLKEPR